MSVSMQFGKPSGAVNTGKRWKLIWENVSPSSSFGAQTVALNLSNYSEVLIGCSPFGATNLAMSQGFVGYDIRIFIMSATNNRNGMRDVSITATGITFSACQYNNETHNNYCVPLYIWAR